MNLTYDEMKRLTEDGHICAKCGGRLILAWSAAEGYTVRCGNKTHEGFTIHDRERENKIMEVRKDKEMVMNSTSLTTMKEPQMLARIGMAKFPQELTQPEKLLLAKVAITYGFDPLMGEVTIYQGKPYVSIDGRYRKAQETGLLNGVDARPATQEERTNWKIPAEDYFFRADVHVKGAAFPFVGWGRVFQSETTNGKGFKPVEKNPQRMAEKRAEAQALRKAFHIPLPSAEDIGSPIDGPEIIEGQAKVIDAKVPGEKHTNTAPDASQDGQGNGDKPKRDPNTIKTLVVLYKACINDWPETFKSSTDVIKELGYTRQLDIVEPPAACYATIADTRQKRPE